MYDKLPKISVILPVFNVERYLRQCLDSIINQSLKELEIICVNDASTDNSGAILEEYAAKDKRFIVIHQNNLGQGAARNKALEIISGEYVTFVDPDDWLDTDALEISYNKIKQTNSDILLYDFIEYKENSGRYKKKCFARQVKKECGYDICKNYIYNCKSIAKNKFAGIGLYVWNKLYSKELIKCHNIRFAANKFGEDHIFSLVAFLNADSVYYLNKYLYYYRTRKNTSNFSYSDDNFCIFDNVELFKQYLIDNKLFEELHDEFEKYKFNAYKWHYNKILPQSQEKYLQKCNENFSENDYINFLKKVSQKQNFICKILNRCKSGFRIS